MKENECRTQLMHHINEHGCITRADFMRLTGNSRDKAIELLKRYLEEGIIRKYGEGKIVVYLKVNGFLLSLERCNRSKKNQILHR